MKHLEINQQLKLWASPILVTFNPYRKEVLFSAYSQTLLLIGTCHGEVLNFVNHMASKCSLTEKKSRILISIQTQNAALRTLNLDYFFCWGLFQRVSVKNKIIFVMFGFTFKVWQWKHIYYTTVTLKGRIWAKLKKCDNLWANCFYIYSQTLAIQPQNYSIMLTKVKTFIRITVEQKLKWRYTHPLLKIVNEYKVHYLSFSIV